jgi:hypothetical protein
MRDTATDETQEKKQHKRSRRRSNSGGRVIFSLPTMTSAADAVNHTNSSAVNGVNAMSANDAELVEALRQTLSQKLNESGEEKRFVCSLYSIPSSLSLSV